MSSICRKCLKQMPKDRKGYEQICPECKGDIMSKTIEQELAELARFLDYGCGVKDSETVARHLTTAGYRKSKPPVVEAGEGVKWPKRAEHEENCVFHSSRGGACDCGAMSENKMHRAFTTILKQKGLL